MRLVTRITFFLAIGLATILNSCAPEIEPQDQRTAEIEALEIKFFLDQVLEQDLPLDSTELGIYFIVDTLGSGPTPKAGDTCYIKYTGAFLSGEVFDASEFHPQNPDGVWSFVYKDMPLISGFEDGIGIMNKGTRMDVIIPSEHGYGPYGSYPTIPPYAPLFFALEMVDIKPVLEQ